MNFKISLFTSALALVGLAGVASAHLHISLADENGDGTLEILTYGTDATFTGDNNLLVNLDGSPLVTPLEFAQVGGPFDGFVGGAARTMTTDFYSSAAFDPLAGGDYSYELAGVTAVDGSADNVIGFLIPGHMGDGQTARTDADLAGRLLDFDNGYHPHGQTLFSLLPGTYDLTLIAHDLRDDVAGRLDSSAPVSLRITAVPEPSSLALIATGGLVLLRRRRA